MKIIQGEQGSQEWFDARCGIPTASNFDKLITGKGEPSKQSKKYLYRLAGEQITGKAEETYQNDAMKRGSEMEAEARLLYEIKTGKSVKEVGFCLSDGEFKYGCSPDGLVGKDGLVEIKCPNMATHVGYLLDNKLPSDYLQQVQGQLLVTDRQWCDFISYYPAIKPFIIRVKRDHVFLKKLEVELKLFCKELNATTERIK